MISGGSFKNRVQSIDSPDDPLVKPNHTAKDTISPVPFTHVPGDRESVCVEIDQIGPIHSLD